MRLEMDKPTPIPAGLVVTKGWNRRGTISSARPQPVSVTLTSTMPSSDKAVMTSSSFRSQPCMASTGVAYQIQQHLLNLNLLHKHRPHPRIEAEDRFDTLLLGAHQRERACLLDQLVDVLGPLLGLAARHELAQAADDLSGAQRLLRGLAQGVVDLVRARMLDAFEQTPAAL